jgi:hypothetical protein
MPTPEEYISASMERVKEFSQHAGEDIGPATAAAILAELNTIFKVGVESCLKQLTQ